MNYLSKWRLREKTNIISGPHLWAICLIFCALFFIYYSFEYNRSFLIAWLPWSWHIISFEFLHHINGILLYIPFIYAAFIFGWRGALSFWLGSMLIILPHVVLYSVGYTSLISNILYLSVPLMVALIFTLQLRWIELEKKALAARESDRQAYLSQVFKAQEEERKRIARELHDDTIQTLLVIANRVQSLLNCLSSEVAHNVKEEGKSIRNSILDLKEDVRRLSIDLRPGVLDNLGLLPALGWLTDRINQQGTINARIIVNGDNWQFSPDIGVIVFRFVQEALNNARQHSEANEVLVKLESGSSTVRIVVEDNGKGFFLPKTMNELTTKDAWGIIGMQERARLLGGTFNICSHPGKGTLVTIEFPVNPYVGIC